MPSQFPEVFNKETESVCGTHRCAPSLSLGILCFPFPMSGAVEFGSPGGRPWMADVDFRDFQSSLAHFC